MNSYIRQTQAPAEQMHNFLKDKQAWENAISMYQGPDPLEHWYNYVCWYETHGHGDTENKFRETLERCLTLYEHSDYYKHDPRMVQLWIKYIDMQPNPLHFYQVLHQRGVGKQVANFYISWAGYYESINALKEAESVYSLGFQEKAQSYAELHHAHNKLMYLIRSTTQNSQQHKPPQLQQQGEQQDEQQQLYQQQQQDDNLPRQTAEQVPATQLQNYPQNVFYQEQEQQSSPHAQTDPQNHSQLQPQQTSQMHISMQQHQLYQQYNSYSPQMQPTQQHQEHNALHEHMNGAGQVANYTNAENAEISYIHSEIADEEHLSSAATSPTMERYHKTKEESNSIDKKHKETPVGAIKLPRKFASYCRNNYETWKPALFLEEPADPSRRCHYGKNRVYPGTGMEYSPEELRARRFLGQLGKLSHQPCFMEDAENKSYPLKHHTNLDHLPHAPERQVYAISSCASNGYMPVSERISYQSNKILEPEKVNNFVQLAPQQTQSTNESLSATDDFEDISDISTLQLSMDTTQQSSLNKTIKIKFKKERIVGEQLNGNNYSAYTIEGAYQKGNASPNLDLDSIRRNGHSFHPYMLGQSSTPKTTSKRSKNKLKKPQKLQVAAAFSSSNSSSAENGIPSVIESIPAATDNAIHNATFNDNANYSFSSAVAHDNSNYSLSSAVGRLNFRETTGLANNTSGVADFSTYQENSYFATKHDSAAQETRLKKALETIERHFAKESIDPFNTELCRAFLTKLDFPGSKDAHANYKIIETPLPKIANTRTLTLPEGVHFSIDKEVGRGSYGSVYKATDAKTNSIVALKYQKPPNTWEIYICDQVLKRIQSPNILPGLMDISTAIIAPNASIIATEFSPFGSLLDINNKIRQATSKVMHESLVMHFSAQICNIIHHLHMNKIIHADLKPDNFLLMCVPSTDLHYPSVRLIDFGCAIDMTLFPEPDKTKFRKVIQTDGFTCIEMQEGRPWSYETDLFCIAGTVHVMLLGEYMQLQKRAGAWDIKQKLPRYLKKHVWTQFFGDMLNINASKMPDLSEMCKTFETEAAKMDSELQKQIRTLSNILYRR